MKIICNVQNNCNIKIENLPVFTGVSHIFSNNFVFLGRKIFTCC
jgi:hypothetical protein